MSITGPQNEYDAQIMAEQRATITALRTRLVVADAALAAAREALSQIANGYYTDAAGYNLTAIAQAALHPATKEST